METRGHLGVVLTVITSGAIVLLGADLIAPTLATGAALAGCLVLGACCAPLPNALESLTGTRHRGYPHSILAPVAFAPVCYLLVLGVGTQARTVVGTAIGTATWGAIALGVAGTVGGSWLVHIAVDGATHGRDRFVLRPFAPVSDRSVAVGLFRSDSPIVNASALLVGLLMTALLGVVFCLRALLG
ncbi:metal-dependent hydrolase [Halarchaeum salinum]|uniref:Metal-dependent hydrolase n=1 Tax=Halarchaeum salinum TaxID=489912 RepID=A0AAV3S9P9_9EURY